ncbi:MAG TPA: ATP-binding protein [Pseudonocardiaceae bacterium]|nr:ATP-binding protein [Pseudonocardiaceae bacterium]
MTSRISRGLAAGLVAALAGTAFLIIRLILGSLAPALPIVTTLLAIAVVAAGFLPVRDEIERLMSRITGSGRPTAYHVLAELTSSSRGTTTDASNLTGVAEAIAARLSARSCRLTVIAEGLRDRSYTWPASHPPTADDHVTLPIHQGTERIGTIAVDRAAVASTQRRQLLEDIANGLGAILSVNRLGIELERQLRAALASAEEIAAARRQAVAEMDSERRRMERNLHDGAQHHLVSLRMTLGLVEHGVASGQLATATDALDRLMAQIGNAEAVLAETASGVSAMMLAERGLIAALEADLSDAHPPIAVVASGGLRGQRFPSEIEAAVYFCCLEAVNNARKHAPGATVRIRLSELDGSLRFTVRDDGPGFVLEQRGGGAPGRGLRNVRARITAVGGTISIQSAPGAGTTVEGAVPLPRQQKVLEQARELIREARQLYDGTPQGERLRELHAQLDKPVPATVGGLRGAFQASSALRALDALMRSAPLSGDRASTLRYQLEQVRSGSHELTEIDLLEELRSGSVPLTAEERQVAEQLLGAAGPEPRARLGLASGADATELREMAGQQRERWQRKASHPASTRAVRDAAEVLVQTCEQLLAQVGGD